MRLDIYACVNGEGLEPRLEARLYKVVPIARVRARSAGRARSSTLMRHTHKMATTTSGNAGQFRYLTVSTSLFVAKDQARSVIESIGV